MNGLSNTRDHYGCIAILIHWAMAALLIALVALGVYMVRLPDSGFDTRKVELILYHKQLGLAAFLFVMLRLAWRVTNILPELVDAFPDWQKVLARFVHLAFYAVILALPVTGWLMSSAAGIPVSAFGLFQLPDLIARDEFLFDILVDVHHALGFALGGLIVVHAGAALRHHFALRDDTLKRMLPSLRPEQGPADSSGSDREVVEAKR